MDGAAVEGISKLYEWGGLVTVLVLVNIAQAWFCKLLLQRNAALSDRFADVVQKNTEAFVELREVLRHETNK